MLLNFNSWQSTLSGINLIGKEIFGFDANGESIAGIVERVKFTEKGPIALVNDKEILLVDIIEIAHSTRQETTSNTTEGEENE